MSFVFFYHDTLILQKLLMYTTHNVRWSFQLYAINVDLVYNES
jgi:hypothetical protein